MSTVSVDDVMNEITELRKEVKSLAKMLRKVSKVQEDPEGTKSKEKSENQGFNKKHPVTDELCDFLGVPKGTLVSRTDCSRFISNYVKEKGLKDPNNTKIIIQDKKLKDILQVPKGEQLSHLNIQKHLTKHFPKKV